MSQQPKKPTQATLKSLYKDLRQLLGIQFNEMVRQFLKTEPDLDKFFTDADNNREFLDEFIDQWCETEEPSIQQSLDCVSAIFLSTFIDQLDDITAQQEGSQENPTK